MAGSGVEFLQGDNDYIADLETLKAFAEAWATEVEVARNGAASLDAYLDAYASGNSNNLAILASGIADNLAELTAARNGEVSLAAFLALLVAKAGLTQDLPAAGFKITGAGDGVVAQDYATMANLAAQIAGGGNPGDIPITSLATGTAAALQRIRVNAAGNGIEGLDDFITNLGVGTATARQQIRVNDTGDGIVGVSDSNVLRHFFANS